MQGSKVGCHCRHSARVRSMMFALPPLRSVSMVLPDKPPADLQKRPLPLTNFQGTLWRSHATIYHPIYFGRNRKHRWDASDDSYGIFYVADSLEGAFAEGYFPDPAMINWIKVGSDFSVPVSGNYLDTHAISEISVTRPVRLVDLRGDGLMAIGADASLITGPHRVSQNWGSALFSHPDNPDGIVWRSRVTNNVVSYALHDRSKDAIRGNPDAPLSAPANKSKLNRLITRFRLAIIR